LEIMVTLCSGATLCMAPQESIMPGTPLTQVVNKHAITYVVLPPSSLQVLTSATLPTVQTLIVAGEACPPSVLEEWASDRVFINGYGPTECTVVATLARCHPGMSTAPIGAPLPNTQVYVLDEHRRMVPIGVVGELYIGGAGVARGYLGRGALTAERFVPHPFEAGERVYRTGDLVRWSEGGDLEFVGRTDHQVKVRGYRIELGEIESVLSAHAAVSQVVVIAREDTPGDKRLVAYYTATEPVSLEQLRAHLLQRLPSHMLPSAYVSLEQMPLMPNRKVDRKALPAPEALTDKITYEAPRTDLEALLAQIWAQVLRVPRVGIQDNFFEIGGDSIKSARLSKRIHLETGRELPLNVLFSRPTVRDIACWITEHTSGTASYRIPLRTVRGSRHTLAFMPTILGSGVHYNRLAQRLTSHCNMVTCRLPGNIAAESTLTRIEDMSAHCKEQLVNGESTEWSLMGWSFGGVLAYEMARQMIAAGVPIRRLILVDAFLPPVMPASGEGPHYADVPGTFEALLNIHGMSATDIQQGAVITDRESMLEIYRANVAALHAYRPQPCDLPIIEIQSAQTLDALRNATYAGRPISSWSGECSLVIVPGDHFSIFSPEHISSLAQAVDTIIAGDDLAVQC
jgi:thioesterase domain-containing protein